MALISPQVPIVFTMSGLSIHQENEIAVYQLFRNDIIGYVDMNCQQICKILHKKM